MDQFLEQALSLTDLIVRIGGQSKWEALNKYNLRELKNRTMNAVKVGSYSQSKYFYFFHQMVEVIVKYLRLCSLFWFFKTEFLGSKANGNSDSLDSDEDS